MEPILKYNIKLRPVEIEDAEFICLLRSNPLLNKNISRTSEKIFDQIKWLEGYKKREEIHNEYYYITEGVNGKKWGTTRIYNLGEDYFTLGSWVFLREAPYGYSIKADIITKEIGFEILNYYECRFEVRKANPTVIKYHKVFNPDIIAQDDLNLYFSLSKEKFENNKTKILNLF